MLQVKERHLPLNLRQSGNTDAQIKITTRIRKGPYWHLAVKSGCWAFATYNHMYHPRAYVKPEDGGLMKDHIAALRCRFNHGAIANIAFNQLWRIPSQLGNPVDDARG